jgi:hypothetical protein
MNIKTTTAIIFLFLLVSPVFAAAAYDYPQIAGITINENTTAAEYLVYFFNLAVAIGAFIAVVMIIIAGIEWVTSSGNPSKIESAKGKIANTLFGVAILLGCYLILNTINSQLSTIKIDNLACDHGIIVSIKRASDGKIKHKCIDSNQAEIEDTILSTISWNFPDNYLLKAYAYSGSGFTGAITEFNCGSGACSGSIPTDTKSIYFLLNNPGIYLYDDNSYVPASPAVKGYPLFTSTSIPDLSKTSNFDNFTKSIDIIQSSDPQIKYQAVAFVDQNYRGRCAFISTNSVSDMDQAPSPYYTDTLGDGTISSIIVTKSNLSAEAVSQDRGEIILYTKKNCGKSDTDITKQIKACHIKIGSSSSGQVNILDSTEKGCANLRQAKDANNLFVLGDEVMSFEITGLAGLVLSTSKYGEGDNNTSCMYFDKESLGGGTCYSNIQDSPIFTVGGKIPLSFIVLPAN